MVGIIGAVLGGTAQLADAGRIITINTAVGAGTGGGISPTIATNNDNSTTGDGPGSTLIDKTFTSVGALDLEFLVSDSFGVTEHFVKETVANQSGATWTAYRLELGFGTGANFVRSGASDGLDFDTPDMDPTPASNVFSALVHASDTLDFSGGVVPNGTTGVSFTFSFDLPDLPASTRTFTLRQTPMSGATAVPLPATVILLTMGVLAMTAAGLRRSR